MVATGEFNLAPSWFCIHFGTTINNGAVAYGEGYWNMIRLPRRCATGLCSYGASVRRIYTTSPRLQSNQSLEKNGNAKLRCTQFLATGQSDV